MANISAIKLPDGNTYNLVDKTSGYITAAAIPVTSVNSKTGAVVLTAADVGALPVDTVVPTIQIVRW